MQSIKASIEGYMKQHNRRNKAANMKYFRSIAGYTLYDHKTDQEIREE
jgi:hypothetical protein